jgi:hypothetical protein
MPINQLEQILTKVVKKKVEMKTRRQEQRNSPINSTVMNLLHTHQLQLASPSLNLMLLRFRLTNLNISSLINPKRSLQTRIRWR